MVRAMIAVATAAALSACANTSTVLLVGPRYAEGDTEIAVQWTVEREIRGVPCQYSHESTIRNGPPFNDRDEVTSEFAGCGWRFDGEK